MQWRFSIITRIDPQLSLEFSIPLDLLQEFERVPRIIVRWPWVVGIPVPEILLKPEWLKRIDAAGFDVMLVPRQRM